MCDCSKNCGCNGYDQAADGCFFGLGNFMNLRGLGDTTIKAGSRARVGFRFSCAFCLIGELEPAEVKNTVEGCLYASGAFSTVSVTVSRGYIYQDYLTVEVTTVFDWGKAEDIGGAIQQQLEQCYPALAKMIDGRDMVLVDAVPVGTPVPTYQTPPPPGGDNAKKGECSKETGLSYAACLVGLKPSQGVWVGAIGTLAGLLLINKLVK